MHETNANRIKGTRRLSLIDAVPVSVIAVIVLWRVLLDVIYPVSIVPKWGYTGFVASFSLSRYVLIVAAQLVTLPFVGGMILRKRLSDVGVLLLYLISFMPGLTIVVYMELPISFIIAFLAFWLILLMLNALLPEIHFKKNFKINTHLVVGIASVFCTLLVLYVWARYANFRINLSIFNVYDLREEANEYNMGTLLDYGFAACRGVVPIMLGYAMANKRKGLAAWFVVLTVMIFSVDGVKTALFSSAVVVVMYVVFRHERGVSAFVYAAALLGVSGVLLSLLGNDYIFDSLIRRIMYLPNYLSTQYYEFFSSNVPDYFRQSFLRNFGFSSPYGTSISVLIGELYYVGGNANSGLLADAFTNLGAAGVVVLPFLIIALLRILEGCTEGLPAFLAYSCAFLVSWHLINSFFFSVLLTHGTLAICLLTYFLPRQRNVRQHETQFRRVSAEKSKPSLKYGFGVKVGRYAKIKN